MNFSSMSTLNKTNVVLVKAGLMYSYASECGVELRSRGIYRQNSNKKQLQLIVTNAQSYI